MKRKLLICLLNCAAHLPSAYGAGVHRVAVRVTFDPTAVAVGYIQRADDGDFEPGCIRADLPLVFESALPNLEVTRDSFYIPDCRLEVTATGELASNFGFVIPHAKLVLSGSRSSNMNLKVKGDWHFSYMYADQDAFLHLETYVVGYDELSLPIAFYTLSLSEPRNNGVAIGFRAGQAFTRGRVSCGGSECSSHSLFAIGQQGSDFWCTATMPTTANVAFDYEFPSADGALSVKPYGLDFESDAPGRSLTEKGITSVQIYSDHISIRGAQHPTAPSRCYEATWSEAAQSERTCARQVVCPAH